MAMISSFVGSVIVVYSYTYISHYEHKSEYYFEVVLFLGAMMGLVYSTNLIFLYVFWEISAICCWRLIGFFREKETIFRANKAFLITVFGALVMLLGFLLIYQEAGTFDMTKLRGTHISDTAVILILAVPAAIAVTSKRPAGSPGLGFCTGLTIATRVLLLVAFKS